LENGIQGLSDSSLLNLGVQAAEVIAGDPASYGCSAQQSLNLTNSATGFGDAIPLVEAKKADYHATVEFKQAKRTALINALRVVAAEMYNDPAVTSDMIIRAGFAVRDTTKTPQMPEEPMDLLATPNANGTVHLAWNRNGSKKGTTFLIETRSEDGDWTLVTSTTASKITLAGFEPGVAAWFRVFARRRNVNSLPSLAVSVYHTQSPVNLQVAA
jgi:hypothetical protein